MNNAVGEVILGGSFSYCGEVFLHKSGTVTIPEIPGKQFRPSDIIYQTASSYANGGAKYTVDKEVATKVMANRVKGGEAQATLERMVRISLGINRIIAKRGTQTNVSSDPLKLPDYARRRYAAALASNRPEDYWSALEIDRVMNRHDPSGLKWYLVNKWVDEELKIKIGGELHLEPEQAITSQLVNAMHRYQSTGGKLGTSALEAIAEFTTHCIDFKKVF